MENRLHLTRVKLEQFRKFDGSIEVAGMEPGLNILHGPQETGKSTLVAAIRAAFLERCGSSVHADYQPTGNTGATPTVELDFAYDGTNYKLAKTFVHKTRCDLEAGAGNRFNGAQAEDMLGDLLGFGFSAKGKNSTDRLGVPGLLWVEQGRHEVSAAIRNASDRLSKTLQQGVGEMTSTTGDALIERIQQERAQLLTDGGKARKGSPLFEAQESVKHLEQEAKDLETKVDAYRARVDEYAQVMPQIKGMEEQKPWERHRDQADQAKEALGACQQLTSNHKRAEDALRAATRHHEVLEEALQNARRERDELAEREIEATRANESLEHVAQLEAQAKERVDQATEDQRSAREQFLLAKAARRRQELGHTVEDLRARLLRDRETFNTAELIEADLRDHLQAQSTLGIEEGDVSELRSLVDDLRIANATIEGAATRLEFDLVGTSAASLDGQALSGTGGLLLTDRSTLVIDGVGTLVITPGGDELTRLRSEIERLGSERDEMLARLHVADLTAAETQLHGYLEAVSSTDAARQRLTDLVPSGVTALKSSIEIDTGKHAAIEAELATLPEPPATAISFEEAEHNEEEANNCVTVASDARSETAGTRATQLALVERLRREIATTKSRLVAPGAVLKLREQEAGLLEAAARIETCTREERELREQLAHADPDGLELQVQRFRNAERESRKRYTELKTRKDGLEATLYNDEAFGLEERLAEQVQQLEAARRRLDQYERRARALDHLLERMESHRRRMTERLTAPLKQAVQPYLDILLPGASPELSIDESMAPRHLTRQAGTTGATLPVDALSYGTQEQLSLVTRLAYASLLAGQGHPAMVMLDDALTHSDKDRLELMKRVMLMAATSCQIMLFTCQPERWEDTGAPMFDLRALAAR